MSAQIITAEDAEVLIATSPDASLQRRVDAATGKTFTDYVLFDSAVYVDGPPKGASWFMRAYDDHAAKTGIRPACSIVYIGEPGTDSRRPMVRTASSALDAVLAILESAYAARAAFNA